MKAPAVQSSRVAFDGALMMDSKIARTIFATGAATDNVGGFVAPCDLTLVRAVINILASTTATAARISFGTPSASGSMLSNFPINSKAAGAYDITLASQWASKVVTKGSYVKAKFAAAAAVGVVAGTFIWAPTAQVA